MIERGRVSADVKYKLLVAFAFTKVDVLAKGGHSSTLRCVNTPTGGMRLLYCPQLSMYRFE